MFVISQNNNEMEHYYLALLTSSINKTEDRRFEIFVNAFNEDAEKAVCYLIKLLKFNNFNNIENYLLFLSNYPNHYEHFILSITEKNNWDDLLNSVDKITNVESYYFTLNLISNQWETDVNNQANNKPFSTLARALKNRVQEILIWSKLLDDTLYDYQSHLSLLT